MYNQTRKFHNVKYIKEKEQVDIVYYNMVAMIKENQRDELKRINSIEK